MQTRQKAQKGFEKFYAQAHEKAFRALVIRAENASLIREAAWKIDNDSRLLNFESDGTGHSIICPKSGQTIGFLTAETIERIKEIHGDTAETMINAQRVRVAPEWFGESRQNHKILAKRDPAGFFAFSIGKVFNLSERKTNQKETCDSLLEAAETRAVYFEKATMAMRAGRTTFELLVECTEYARKILYLCAPKYLEQVVTLPKMVELADTLDNADADSERFWLAIREALRSIVVEIVHSFLNKNRQNRREFAKYAISAYTIGRINIEFEGMNSMGASVFDEKPAALSESTIETLRFLEEQAGIDFSEFNDELGEKEMRRLSLLTSGRRAERDKAAKKKLNAQIDKRRERIGSDALSAIDALSNFLDNKANEKSNGEKPVSYTQKELPRANGSLFKNLNK